ncbi:MAG: hypothetical protein WC948_03130 [Thermovirgaceae bacterium]
MNVLGREEIFKLAEHESTPSVSLYMSETRPHDPKKSQIRFKNLIAKAEEILGGFDLRPHQREALLSEARSLLSNSVFWERQNENLALFVALGVFQVLNIPSEVNDVVTVSDRFHIKPLLPLLAGGEEFLVLYLSQKQIRMLRFGRGTVAEVPLEGVSTSLSEALQYNPMEKQGQFGGAYPTHGAEEEDFKANIRRFFRIVDDGLQKILREEKLPLVTAGVSSLNSIYREANTYAGLLEESIEGNPEAFKDSEIREKAWKIVKPLFERSKKEALERFGHLQGTGKTSDSLEEVVPASVQGRVDTLFVALGKQAWGCYDAESGVMVLEDAHAFGNRDLLDLAAVSTLKGGGKVYAVAPEEVPGGSDLAALFRY